ncbi:MucR family transcriptional regulator [Microvirga massiliensis]|uniref:MucR family transcriptional regulator n=1 Tax=Microvirga massiliensis TaxID=1033741 RepID=UPI00062B4885|nr:MucR family transcriptional regulator [Microvirga massiliensis]
MTDQATSSRNVIELTAEIVSAFVSNNSVSAADLPALIGSLHATLQQIGNPAQKPDEPKPVPAVPVKKSITPDYLISLEDGKPYKSLKRHLTHLGLTPEQYRKKWGLPVNYPMVAPSYTAKRSELAKRMGLGQKRKGAAKTAATSVKIAAPAANRRGTKKSK